MKTVCTCGRATICAHKRNVDPNLIMCAIDADKIRCTFAVPAKEYFDRLQKISEV